jgi:serine/threonine-protein kinase
MANVGSNRDDSGEPASQRSDQRGDEIARHADSVETIFEPSTSRVAGPERADPLAETVNMESIPGGNPEVARPESADFVIKGPGEAVTIDGQFFGSAQTVAFDPARPMKARRPAPKIPGYEILSELGRGGMGVVYKALQIRLERLCALKMILGGAHATPEAAQRFLSEASAIAKVQHPNIVQIYHIGENDGLPFFELEFVPGGSLEKALGGVPWQARRAAQISEQLCRAMEHAHRQGIVHRDLKPANVLLTREGDPKITDFGLAKALDSDAGVTKTEAILGSPSYMAPEQAEGMAKEATAQTDVYSLGAILYEIVTGRPPFRGATVLETLELVKKEEPVPPSRLIPHLPRDLETICLKCLAKAPHQRYVSAGEVADELQRFIRDEPIKARPISRWHRAVRWCYRNPRDAVLAGLAVLVPLALATGSAFAAYRISLERNRAEHQKGIAEQKEQIAEAKEVEARLAQAEASKQAKLALDTIYTVVTKAEEKLRARAEMGPLRKQLLELAMKNLDQIARDAETSGLVDRTMGVTLQRVGNLYEISGDTPKGVEAYQRSLGIFKKLIPLQPDEDWLPFDAAISYDHLGEVGREIEPDPAKLLELYGQAQSLRKTLVEHPKKPMPSSFQRKYAMAVSSIKLAALAMELGDPAFALEQAKDALRASELLGLEVPIDPNAKQLKESQISQLVLLAQSYFFLARAEHRLGQDDVARTHAQKSIEPLERILKQDPAYVYASQELGRSYDAIGEAEQERDERDASLQSLGKARDLFTELVKKDSTNPEVQWYLANTEYRLASLLELMGNPEAGPLFKKCLKTREVLRTNDPANIQREIEVMRAVAHTGDLKEADRLARKVLAYAPRHPGKLFETACAKAQCARVAASGDTADRKLADRYAAEAAAILKQAIASGYKDGRSLATTPDLAPLRGRPDFQSLLETLKANGSSGVSRDPLVSRPS